MPQYHYNTTAMVNVYSSGIASLQQMKQLQYSPEAILQILQVLGVNRLERRRDERWTSRCVAFVFYFC